YTIARTHARTAFKINFSQHREVSPDAPSPPASIVHTRLSGLRTVRPSSVVWPSSALLPIPAGVQPSPSIPLRCNTSGEQLHYQAAAFPASAQCIHPSLSVVAGAQPSRLIHTH